MLLQAPAPRRADVAHPHPGAGNRRYFAAAAPQERACRVLPLEEASLPGECDGHGRFYCVAERSTRTSSPAPDFKSATTNRRYHQESREAQMKTKLTSVALLSTAIAITALYHARKVQATAAAINVNTYG